MNTIEWAEELPKQCPPERAAEPNDEMFYRLISSLPLQEGDFHSQRKLKPNAIFNVDECTAMAVSLFNDIKSVYIALKLPNLRKKKVLEISLPQNSGLIMQTGTNKHHISWWRAKGFLPISHKLVE